METKIVIHEEKNRLIWEKASEFIINWLKLYHNIGQKTLLLLSGGSMVKIYYDLAKFIKNSELNFDFLALGQIDERFQPENNEDINAGTIGRTGLWEVCKKKNISHHLISQTGLLEGAADKYDQQISKIFEQSVYKIGILGIGEDGHTAGLLPGFQSNWDINKFAVGFANDSKFKERISLTPKALIQFDQTIVVAVGEKKRSAIREILDSKNADNFNKFPAALLQKCKKVDLFTDQQI